MDYLLRLQESIKDLYSLYEQGALDADGAEVLSSTIAIAVQVFRSITEFMQGPCLENQMAVSRSRVWDVVAGFLAFFAQCQDAGNWTAQQLELKRDVQTMLSELVVMLLALLEGAELHSAPAVRLVHVLHECQPQVTSMLSHFSVFTNVLSSAAHRAFLALDDNGDGQISKDEFRKALQVQRHLGEAEIELLLEQMDLNNDDAIDYAEFAHRFLQPTIRSGFNVVVLFTQLDQLVSGTPAETQLASFLALGTPGYLLLRHFRDELGLVEVVGCGGHVERVYFRIPPDDAKRWNSEHLCESKERFFNAVERDNVNIKHSHFVDFCEDMIFEMRHTAEVMGERQGAIVQDAETALQVAEASHARVTSEPVADLGREEQVQRSRQRMTSSRGSLATLLARGSEPLRYASMLLTVLINMILLCYRAPQSPSSAEAMEAEEGRSLGGLDASFELRPAYLERTLAVLAVLHTVAGIGLWFSFFVLKVRVGHMGPGGLWWGLGEWKRSQSTQQPQPSQSWSAGMCQASRGVNCDRLTPPCNLISPPFSPPLSDQMPVVVFQHEKDINRRLRSIDLEWLRFSRRGLTGLFSLQAWRRWWHDLALASQDFPLLHHDQEARGFARAQSSFQGDTIEVVLPNVARGGTRVGSLDLRYALWSSGLILFNGGFLYRLAYVILSVLAWTWNPFLFCWHLLDIALQNAILLNVLRSVVHNGRQLLFTVAFTACVIYIYTIIAFNFFRTFYQDGERNMCDNMLTCFVYNLNTGLRSGGGIGDELGSAIGTDVELYRIIFDVSFFFIVIVILLAIVQVRVGRQYRSAMKRV